MEIINIHYISYPEFEIGDSIVVLPSTASYYCEYSLINSSIGAPNPYTIFDKRYGKA